MTAAPSTRPRPTLVVEAKRADTHPFDESKHPRDKHGRFISIGAHVDLGDGHGGRVLAATHNSIIVRRDNNGKTQVIKGDALKAVSVAHDPKPSDAAKPANHQPYAQRPPRVGDVVVLHDGREGQVGRVYADGRSVRFGFVNPDGSLTRERVDKTQVAAITSAAPDPGDPDRGKPDLSGIQHLPADVRQELTDAVQEMTSLYEVPFAGVSAREEDWHGGDSFAIGGTRIIFNPKIEDPEFRDKNLKNGSGYTLGRTLREAFIHEFGHTIDRQYIADEGKKDRKNPAPLHRMFEEVMKTGDHVAMQGEDNPNYNPNDPDNNNIWIYPDGTYADLAERVSMYASSGNTGESVAEAFLAGHLGRTNRYTLAVRTAFAPYVRQGGGDTTVDPTDDGTRIVEPLGPRPVPGPDPSTMTSTAITTELRALGESLNGMDPSGRAWGPIAARRDLLANELLSRAGYGSLATEGRKVAPGATLHAMGTGRPRPHFMVEEKAAARPFEPEKHPRDNRGRWAHTPGGKRVKIPEGYHVGAQVEVHLPDFSRQGAARGYPSKWHRATIENVTAHESGRTLAVQTRMHGDGRPHVETIGIRGGNNRIRPVANGGILPDLPKRGRKDGTGTVDDPIEVGDDLGRAAQLLAEGKHVRLSQPEQVATLLDKLREIAADARSKGQKAPKYDLCRVSVPGTNLFCKQSKGIPRAKMPQFKGEIVPGSPAEAFRTPKGRGDISEPFRNALAAMGLPIEAKTVPASHLRASQNELDGAKIAEMMTAIEQGLIKDAPIFVTRDGYVIDGHHRWAAKVAIDTRDGKVGDVMMPVEIVDLDIGAAIDYANAFAKAMGIAPKSVHQGKVMSLTVPAIAGKPRPSIGRSAQDALTDALEVKGAEEGSVADQAETQEENGQVSPVSRVAQGLDAVYGTLPEHRALRAIGRVYAAKALAGDVPDLAEIGIAAPGHEPVGAHAFFVGPDGVEAWLDASGPQPVGYLRDTTRPLRSVRIDDPYAWAQLVDHLGLHEEVVPTVRIPAPSAHADDGEAVEGDGQQLVDQNADTAPPAEESADTEAKSAHGKFEETKHPRDKHGRFMHIGDGVDLGGGSQGKITGTTADGKLQVRKADGTTVKVDAHTVAKTSSGSAPKVPGDGTAKPGTDGTAKPSPPSTPSQNGGRTAPDVVSSVTGGADGGRGNGPHSDLADADLVQQLQSTSPGPEFDSLYEEADTRAGAYAKQLLDHVGVVEPDVTKTLTSMADQFSARMEGLDFRLKAHDSLSRKIRDKTLVSGKSMDTVRDKVGDALRYTMILDEDHYAEGAKAVMERFASQGFEITDQDNSWHPGNVYQGINANFRTPDGVLFELQFHTQSSFDTKMQTHQDYKTARDPNATLAERMAAWDRMTALQAKVPIPPNVGHVGILRVYDPPGGATAAPAGGAAGASPARATG